MNKTRFASAAMAALLTFSAGSGLIPQLGNTTVITASAAEEDNDRIAGNKFIIAQVITANALFYTKPNHAVVHLEKGETVYVLKVSNNIAYAYCPRLKKYGYVDTKYLKIIQIIR